jgi:hypothetical protein
MEHFATSLEGMHDTVTTCQVVLSQLVDGELHTLSVLLSSLADRFFRLLRALNCCSRGLSTVLNLM